MPTKQRDLFDILAAGQAPELHRELTNKSLFSQPLSEAATNRLNDDQLIVKIMGSPFFLPPELSQFSEFIEVVEEAHIKKHGADFVKSCHGLMYINQHYLEPEEYSRAGHVHIDSAHASDVIDGIIPDAEVYTTSDIDALTTRIFTHPFELSREFYQVANRRYGTDVIETTFNEDLRKQADVERSITPPAYQIVSYAATQPHQARTPVEEGVTRTFVALILNPVNEPYLERDFNALKARAGQSNTPLQRWMMQNPPEYDMRLGEAKLRL